MNKVCIALVLASTTSAAIDSALRASNRMAEISMMPVVLRMESGMPPVGRTVLT